MKKTDREFIDMTTMNPSDIVWEIEKQIASNVDQASAVVRELVQQLKQNAWPEKDAFGIHMAAEEALMNAVKHGNELDESKKVDVIIRLTNDHFYARIADEGEGFDPDDVPDPCEDCNIDKTSGRGVSLIRKFVDSVWYNESGNVIEFEKKRS